MTWSRKCHRHKGNRPHVGLRNSNIVRCRCDVLQPIKLERFHDASNHFSHFSPTRILKPPCLTNSNEHSKPTLTFRAYLHLIVAHHTRPSFSFEERVSCLYEPKLDCLPYLDSQLETDTGHAVDILTHIGSIRPSLIVSLSVCNPINHDASVQLESPTPRPLHGSSAGVVVIDRQYLPSLWH
jgi:hypothetical protein